MGADLSPPIICPRSDLELSDPELLPGISWHVDRSIVVGIIIGILVRNVRRAVNAVVVQEAIGF